LLMVLKIELNMKAMTLMLLTTFFTFSSIAQDSIKFIPKSDIGLRMSVGSQKQISFDYRKFLKNDLKLIFGADFLNSSNFQGNTQVISTSSNAVVFQQFYENTARPNLRVGVEKSLVKWPNLYGGINLLVGYHQTNSQHSNYTDTLFANGNWATVQNFDRPFEGVTNYKNHFISSGVMLMTGWDVPISDHFIFNLNVSQTFEAVFQVGPSDTSPNGRYAGRTNQLNSNSILGLGLRYTL
jgi:hypothetical protein